MTEVNLAKKLQAYNNVNDPLSQLPDEILINVLSLLPLKEAGRSSVLSRRWRNLWKMTGRLDFDAREKPLELFDSSSRKSRRARSTRYVTWVNEVLKLHECPFIEEFRIKFDLDITANNDLGNWIKFLTPKRVKILDINLSHCNLSKACTLSQECYHHFRSYNCLRSISLDSINIDGKLLRYFLSRCPHLETLTISSARRPINFKVKVTNPSLRHLEIYQCHLTTIELSAPKLETLKYLGAETEFRIGDNPCLTNLSLGGRYDEKVMNALVPFAEHLPQLETLRINVLLVGLTERCMEIPQVSQLSNLKHLVLEAKVSGDTSIIGIATIIAAAPFLDTFTLQISCEDPIFERPNVSSPARQIHQSLRVVELLGFVGFYSDFELAAFLLTNAINLERIVIDPYRLGPNDDPSSNGGIEMETENIRKRAYDGLKDSLPPRAQLVIL